MDGSFGGVQTMPMADGSIPNMSAMGPMGATIMPGDAWGMDRVGIPGANGNVLMEGVNPSGMPMDGMGMPMGYAGGMSMPMGNAGGMSMPMGNAGGMSMPMGNAGGMSMPMGNAGGMSMPMGNAGGISMPMGNVDSMGMPMGNAGDMSMPMGNADGMGMTMGNAGGMSMPMGHAGGMSIPMGNPGGINVGMNATPVSGHAGSMPNLDSATVGTPCFGKSQPSLPIRGRSMSQGVMQMPVGRFIPGEREGHLYRYLFQKAQGDVSGYISGKQAKQMFMSTGCPRKVLHEVWAFADSQQEGRLDFSSFCVACRMLAHSQGGLPFDPELLQVEPQQPLHLPGFMDDRSRSASASRHASRSASRSPRRTWTLTQKDKDKYLALFIATDDDRDGFVEGDQGKALLSRSKLTNKQLSAVWDLADMDSDGRLRFEEFLIAMHCVTMIQKGHPIPKTIPQELLDAVRIVDGLNSEGKFGKPMPEISSNHVTELKQSDFARKALGLSSEAQAQSPRRKPDSMREDSMRKPQVDASEWNADPMVFPDILKDVESRSKLLKPLQKPSHGDFDITGASALSKAWATDAMIHSGGQNANVLTGLEMEMVDQREAMEKQFSRRKEFDTQANEFKMQIDDLLEQRAKQDVERQKLVTACENFQDQISFVQEQITDAEHDISVMQESNVSASRGARNPITATCSSSRAEQRDEILSHVRAEREILKGDQRTIDELRVELTRQVKDKLQKQTRQTILLEKHRQAEQDRVMLVTALEGDRCKLLTIRSERLKLLEERAELSALKAELETRRDAKLQQKELNAREENAARQKGPLNTPSAFPNSNGQWTEFGPSHSRTGGEEWESFGR